MKRLIVNADDFGWTAGINRAICQAFREGIVTSTTLMANGAAFEDAVALAKTNPSLGVGCHLVLVGGAAVGPLDKVRGLAREHGSLPSTLATLFCRMATGQAGIEELREEMLAQVAKVRSAGIEPTHLDTHKHTHCHPLVLRALAQVMEETGMRKVRRPYESPGAILRSVGTMKKGAAWTQKASAMAALVTEPFFNRVTLRQSWVVPDRFFGIAATGRLDERGLANFLESLTDGVSELMCHPGEWDAELAASGTRLGKQRQDELTALLTPELRNVLGHRSVKLISYRDLAE